MTTEQTVIQTLAEMTERSAGSISPESRLTQDLGIRSLARFELAVRLELSLHKPVNNAQLMRVRTVSDLLTLLESD